MSYLNTTEKIKRHNGNNITIIGIAGKARSGKDTMGEYLLNHLPKSITLSYAYPLKKEVATMLGLTIEQLNKYKNNNIPYQGTNIRRMLQEVADAHRQKDPTYYIKKMNERITKYIEEGYCNIIVTDVRYILEADELRRFGNQSTKIIRVVRDSITIKESNHPSEQEVDSIIPDFTIYNNSTLQEFHTEIIRTLHHIL